MIVVRLMTSCGSTNYDIDLTIFNDMAMMTLGELKDWMQKASGPQIKRAGRGLTGVMVAAVTKLMSVHDMVYNTRKIEFPTQARTHLGLAGSLSTRIQPNHPTDDLNAITALTWMGLSMGNGDLLIGLNPADDTVDNIGACLIHLDKIRRQTGAPTQVCVLSHIRTQLACLEAGAPLEILFQSLAGTDATLREAIDVSVAYLDQAWQTMKEKGVLNQHQFMYFETGQGSEVSYGKHGGIDMSTTEALTYGLCRRYDPCMVNSVTGFIGPETHKDSLQIIYANLQDLFMGKVMGLPMGVSPCFTLHADASSEGQEIAVELLAVAGANYFMDIYLGVDRMLAYADTSGHDDQTIREIHNLKPSPEFYHWALEKGIFKEIDFRLIRSRANNIERHHNIYYGGIPPMEADSLLAERAMQILDNKAAGNRLNAILGSRMGLSDIIRDSKVEPQKTASTIRVHDFLRQKSISEADVMVLIHWGVKEILLSREPLSHCWLGIC